VGGWGDLFVRLIVVEHLYLIIESLNDFVKHRMRSLYDESHIFLSWLVIRADAPEFRRLDEIAFLLLISVKPAKEQSCPLSLLPLVGAAHIKQNLRVKTEELFDDTDDCLCNLHITGRLCMLWVCQVEPVGRVEGVGIQFEVDGIDDVEVRLKHVLPRLAEKNLILCMSIHHFQIKCIHLIL